MVVTNNPGKLQYTHLGVAEKLRIIIFRCAAPRVSNLIDYSTKIIATLWLVFQVQRTGYLCPKDSFGVEIYPLMGIKVQRTERLNARFIHPFP